MKNRKILSLLLAGAMTTALLATPAQAAEHQPQTPASYAISADHWSREDFFQQASSEGFDRGLSAGAVKPRGTPHRGAGGI